MIELPNFSINEYDKDGLSCVKQEDLMHYPRNSGQEFYPGQFKPCKKRPQNDEYVKY